MREKVALWEKERRKVELVVEKITAEEGILEAENETMEGYVKVLIQERKSEAAKRRDLEKARIQQVLQTQKMAQRVEQISKEKAIIGNLKSGLEAERTHLEDKNQELANEASSLRREVGRVKEANIACEAGLQADLEGLRNQRSILHSEVQMLTARVSQMEHEREEQKEVFDRVLEKASVIISRRLETLENRVLVKSAQNHYLGQGNGTNKTLISGNSVNSGYVGFGQFKGSVIIAIIIHSLFYSPLYIIIINIMDFAYNLSLPTPSCLLPLAIHISLINGSLTPPTPPYRQPLSPAFLHSDDSDILKHISTAQLKSVFLLTEYLTPSRPLHKSALLAQLESRRVEFLQIAQKALCSGAAETTLREKLKEVREDSRKNKLKKGAWARVKSEIREIARKLEEVERKTDMRTLHSKQTKEGFQQMIRDVRVVKKTLVTLGNETEHTQGNSMNRVGSYQIIIIV